MLSLPLPPSDDDDCVMIHFHKLTLELLGSSKEPATPKRRMIKAGGKILGRENAFYVRNGECE